MHGFSNTPAWLTPVRQELFFSNRTGHFLLLNHTPSPFERAGVRYELKSPSNIDGLFLKYHFKLNSKTFSTTTTPAGIGIIKVKTFTVQAIAEFKFCIYEV